MQNSNYILVDRIALIRYLQRVYVGIYYYFLLDNHRRRQKSKLKNLLDVESVG